MNILDKNSSGKSRRVAALLSAFACPGVGQLYKGHRFRGILLVGVSLIIVTAAFLKFVIVTFEATMNLPPAYLYENLLGVIYDALRPEGGFFISALLGFLAVWVYSVVDALVSRPG